MSNGDEAYLKINIVKGYNELVEEIPFDSLQSLPQKLEPLKKYAGLVGLKLDDLEDFDVAGPIKKVVTFMGVLVKRLRIAEKSIVRMQEEIDALKNA